jgi:hypothetical protein
MGQRAKIEVGKVRGWEGEKRESAEHRAKGEGLSAED